MKHKTTKNKSMRMIQSTIVLLALIFWAGALLAQEEAKPPADEPKPRAAPDSKILDEQEWKQLDQSVERALSWLATQQKDVGSFESVDPGQPAVTSFCLMAFLAQGESPSDGQYKEQLSKAIDFIVSQQKPNGLIATTAPKEVPIPRDCEHKNVGQTSSYNHAISALGLCEAYGQCDPEQAKQITPVIEKAIAATLEMQRWGKPKLHTGGWRYLTERYVGYDSDLSVTGWQLMFLRSAKNAGFDVEKESIDSAVAYVENCFLKRGDRKVHGYLAGSNDACTRAMAGAGVLALVHAGKQDSEEALSSAEWILKHNFSKYGDDTPQYGATWWQDPYHYGAFRCTLAKYQLGGSYRKEFYPGLVEPLLENQEVAGSWPAEPRDKQFGKCYSTALGVLTLSVPNQILPIFQR